MDAWYEEEERVLGHPRDPYHRVDTRDISRHVRVVLDGKTLADRKSTRLNSSHANISYAVFCLKKKKEKTNITIQHHHSLIRYRDARFVYRHLLESRIRFRVLR